MGVVTRVRFEAEGRDHDDVLEALDEATALLRPKMMAEVAVSEQSNVAGVERAGFGHPGTQSSLAVGGLRDAEGQVADIEFVEEVIESRVSEGTGTSGLAASLEGAIYYVGRRVLKVVERPLDLREPMR